MKYRVLVEEPAWQDIEAAYEWLLERAPTHAARWFNELEAAVVVSLAANPERCPRAAEADEIGRDIRQLVHGKRGGRYRVLFEIRGRTVHVLHVRHGAREKLTRESLE